MRTSFEEVQPEFQPSSWQPATELLSVLNNENTTSTGHRSFTILTIMPLIFPNHLQLDENPFHALLLNDLATQIAVHARRER